MSNTPRINWALFVLYVLLTVGVLVAALVWPSVRAVAYAPLRDFFWPAYFLPTSENIRAAITVAVPPTLESWAREAARDFTQQNPQIEVQIIQLRGTEATRRLNAGVADLPDVWIAEADFVRINVGGIPYQSSGASIGRDSLVWIAVSSRSDLASNLSWQAVFDAAQNDLRFSIAMPPVNSIEGMAACLSAAAEYHQQGNLTAEMVSDAAFQRWLSELLEAAPNRSRSPRDQLGSRPPEVDVGLTLNSDWHQLPQQSFFRQPPQYNVVFNYPYLIRSNWYELSDDEAYAHRVAAERFRDFLLGSGPQSELPDHGLQRADAEPTGQVVQAEEPAIRALQACWQ